VLAVKNATIVLVTKLKCIPLTKFKSTLHCDNVSDYVVHYNLRMAMSFEPCRSSKKGIFTCLNFKKSFTVNRAISGDWNNIQ